MNLLQMCGWCVVAMIFMVGGYNWLSTGTPTVLIVILGTFLTIAIVGGGMWLIVYLTSFNQSLDFIWKRVRNMIGENKPETKPIPNPYGLHISDEQGKPQFITYDEIYGSTDHHHPSLQREALEHRSFPNNQMIEQEKTR